MGRKKDGKPPISYSDELAIKVLDMLAEGMSLQQITRLPGMPARKTVYLWLKKFPDFMQLYLLAREDQAETYADEIIDIADCSTPEDYQCARLRVDARKWVACKLKPRRFGDKVDLNHGGGLTVTRKIYSFKDDGDDRDSE